MDYADLCRQNVDPTPPRKIYRNAPACTMLLLQLRSLFFNLNCPISRNIKVVCANATELVSFWADSEQRKRGYSIMSIRLLSRLLLCKNKLHLLIVCIGGGMRINRGKWGKLGVFPGRIWSKNNFFICWEIHIATDSSFPWYQIIFHSSLTRLQKSALACFSNILDMKVINDVAFLAKLWSRMIHISTDKSGKCILLKCFCETWNYGRSVNQFLANDYC